MDAQIMPSMTCTMPVIISPVRSAAQPTALHIAPLHKLDKSGRSLEAQNADFWLAPDHAFASLSAGVII